MYNKDKLVLNNLKVSKNECKKCKRDAPFILLFATLPKHMKSPFLVAYFYIVSIIIGIKIQQ
jgi:hypothetical protein